VPDTDFPANFSGIGLESTIRFAQEGACVLMADVNPVTLETGLLRAREFVPHAKLATFVVDVSKEVQVEAMVAETEKIFGGGVDVIFNNAGIMHPEDDNALNTEEQIWYLFDSDLYRDLTHNINVKGVWWGCKYAIQSMKKHGKGGSIINTASMVAKVGSAAPQLACTSLLVVNIDTASKGAVLALSRELAIVHAKDGIRVNALCPGPLNTPLLQNFLDTPEKKLRRTIHLPTGRFGIV
jgi:NAD(P)-dependent dehydrogenase (short-subunit alcohol dehydrogenase family)